MNTANYTRLTNMKAEINFENQCKFFAQYYRQVIMCDGHAVYECNPEEINGDYLLLTPLSQISEEDLITVAKIFWPSEKMYHTVYYGRMVLFQEDGTVWQYNVIDFLRSKSYALPWMGLSVEELIEAGWVNLKEA